MKKMLKIKSGWVGMMGFGCLFLFLLALRLDVFQGKEASTASDPLQASEKEIWMNIFQQDRKIGYLHRQLSAGQTGFLLTESAAMKINAMGMTQDIHMETRGVLHPDLSIASFTFNLRSSMFLFTVRGRVEGRTLSIWVNENKSEIPMAQNLYLAAGIIDAAWVSGLVPHQTKTFHVLDPATLGRRPVRVTLMGEELLTVMGRRQRTRKVRVDFMGISQTAWIGPQGDILQEEGVLGIGLKRTTRKDALDRRNMASSQDFTALASVAARPPIAEGAQLSLLRLKISGIPPTLFLDGDRQTYAAGRMTIRKEILADLPSASVPGQYKEFLAPDPFIQADHPEIQKRVWAIIAADDPPATRARKLTRWIYEHIEKRPVLSVPDAVTTLEKRVGDCNEHAVLLAAMARAAGIPAQIEAGLVHTGGRFFYHAWNVLYLGQWITVDALMNQIPADVTHIRLVRGGSQQQVDLLGVIGKLSLEILEQSK